MTATNHGLAGALIGATVSLPIAIPLAIASHFLMDSLPHYGIDHKQRDESKIFKTVIKSDIAIALILGAMTITLGKWEMLLVGFVAFSPDLYWIYYFFKNNRSLDFKSTNWYARFHHRIQQYERPWGIYVELVFAIVMAPFVWHYLFV